MSFLNPVNEPVLRFSSTDASAPQINYNARVAGDVKTVLKACLVTGYGAKTSAGWTAVNETATVIEFVSPSAAMSDYRLGINDTSTASTTWYYQYQDAKVSPSSNTQEKQISAIKNTSLKNGWQLFVTDRGIVLLEIFEMIINSKLNVRVTYFGAIKSALLGAGSSVNIAYWCVGASSTSDTPYSFFANTAERANYRLGTLSGLSMTAANYRYATSGSTKVPSAIELNSEIFIEDNLGSVIGQQPAVLLRNGGSYERLVDLHDIVTPDGRTLLGISVGSGTSFSASYFNDTVVTLSVRTDYWEY